MEDQVPDDFVPVDCNKTRVAAEEWKSKNSRWKNLGIKSNQLRRITGEAKGKLANFARVRRDHISLFAEKCGYFVDHFRADNGAYQKWKSDRKQRVSATEASTQHSGDSPAQSERAADVGNGGALQSPGTGDDSLSRPIEPREMLIALHKRLTGYYEVYHYATTKRPRAISVSLLHVSGINKKGGVIECEIHDTNFNRPYFHNRGRIISLGGFLYWEFRPDQQDAIIYCCSYAPSGAKYPGFTVYGIFLTTEGKTREYPVAARAALRYLGETPEEAAQNSIVDLRDADGSPEELLRTKVGGYLSDLKKGKFLRPDLLDMVQETIIPNINNQLSTRAVPFALKMPRVG